MSLDRELLDAKSAIFDPHLVNISVKQHDIELKFLPQLLHYSPNISWKFQAI